MSLIKNSVPRSLPDIATKKQKKNYIVNNNGLIKKLLVLVWTLLLAIFNTLIGLHIALATIWFLKDTKTEIKVGRGVELLPRRYARRIISLYDVKLSKNAMNVLQTRSMASHLDTYSWGQSLQEPVNFDDCFWSKGRLNQKTANWLTWTLRLSFYC
ncbi:hypothetical protein CASFOL_003305 [Castilleja foliolosa]|uniref:Uncharacterized protein n=1 Tax=Castilleja foliolosa TaxID=1961234 RepID=A0ABD3EH89_9LAMI